MNYHSDEWIMEGLQRHFEEAQKTIPKERIVVMTLKGSQNYGLDTETSDIDSYCIYIPTMEELSYYIDYKPKYITTLSGGEIVSFIDIRYFTYALEMRSLYYLDALCTKYYICPNHTYFPIWQQYKMLVDALANANKPAVMKSLNFYANQHSSKVSDNFYLPRRMKGYEKGYDGKALYWLIRCYVVAYLMLENRPFSDYTDERLNQWARPAKESQYSSVSAHWLNRFLFADFQRINDEVLKLYPIDEENNNALINKLKELEKEVLYDYYGESFSTLPGST